MATFRSGSDVQAWLDDQGLDGTLKALRAALDTGRISGDETVRIARAFIAAKERGEDTSSEAEARDLVRRQTVATESQATTAKQALVLAGWALAISIVAALLAAVALLTGSPS